MVEKYQQNKSIHNRSEMVEEMNIGGRIFNLKNDAYIMGILNVTPDSFSDGGRFDRKEIAIEQALKMEANGADIIDIGGESTRPGFEPVDEATEIQRVIPVIKAIRDRSDIPISVDTTKASVAEAAIQAGASMINDIWGFKQDPNMAKVVFKYNVPCCLMHNRKTKEYKNLIEDMIKDLKDSIDIALNEGISKDKIIIDPGIGFAKTLDHNLTVMNQLERFHELKYPILLGTSRKSMIGLSLDLPVNERVEGTIATSVIGVMKGCNFFRVHDILENKRAIRMASIIKNKG